MNAPPRILIVEDDSSSRQTLQNIFELEGFDVVTASNGREALESLAQARPAVIVLDLMMPVMNGWELMQRLNSDDHYANIPVVVASGATEEGEAASAVAFFPKPINLGALVEEVRSLCRKEAVA